MRASCRPPVRGLCGGVGAHSMAWSSRSFCNCFAMTLSLSLRMTYECEHLDRAHGDAVLKDGSHVTTALRGFEAYVHGGASPGQGEGPLVRTPRSLGALALGLGRALAKRLGVVVRPLAHVTADKKTRAAPPEKRKKKKKKVAGGRARRRTHPITIIIRRGMPTADFARWGRGRPLPFPYADSRKVGDFAAEGLRPGRAAAQRQRRARGWWGLREEGAEGRATEEGPQRGRRAPSPSPRPPFPPCR